jgi:2-methylisocitrate lyase-like PEP mutase family enzyme
MPERPGDLLHSMLEASAVVAPGCYDCLSAAVQERAGFTALFLSGAGVAASAAGLPDLGLLSFEELARTARNVVNRAHVPVIVDGDTGFGNELSVVRTVEELGRLGVAAVMIEDQTSPKRCGHLEGKDVIDAGDFVRKIQAAHEAGAASGIRVIARTDALAVNGLDDAVERAAAAREAGADLTFVEAMRSMSELREVAERVPGPKMYALSGGQSPSPSFRELEELGYRLLVIPGAALVPAIQGMRAVAEAMLADGSNEAVERHGMTPRDIFKTVGLDHWLKLAAHFSGDKEATT